MVATGKVEIDGTLQLFSDNDNKNHFTGASNRTITLPGRAGYTRTWEVIKKYDAVGWTLETMDDAYIGTSYTVYISSTRFGFTDIYVNTEWTFTSSDTINKYPLSYNFNDGSLSGGSDAGDYDYDSTINLPTSATRTGYAFNNFSINENTIYGTTFILKGHTEVVANWTINQYTLTYDLNGGSLNGGSGTSIYNYNTTITLPTSRTRTGYRFTSFTSGGTTFGTSFNLTANTVVRANWSINQYNVTYLSTTPLYFGFPSSSILYNYDTLLTTTIITKNPPRVIGQVYTFDKWTYNDNPLGTTRLPDNNIDLKATWTSIDNREIQMSELSTVFDNSPSFRNIEISNYFDELQLISTDDKKNVKFSTKLKGKGKF